MIVWVQQLGRYFVLEEALLFAGDVRKQVSYLENPLAIVRDTSAEMSPPAGLYAPEGAFGPVWRGDVRDSTGYRERLGWALAPRSEYEGVYQCDDAVPSGGQSWQTCYLEGPDERVIVLPPLGGWHWLGER